MVTILADIKVINCAALRRRKLFLRSEKEHYVKTYEIFQVHFFDRIFIALVIGTLS